MTQAAKQLDPGPHWFLTFTEAGQSPVSIVVGPALSVADAVQCVSALGLAPKGQLDARALPMLLADLVHSADRNLLMTQREADALMYSAYIQLGMLASRREHAAWKQAHGVTEQTVEADVDDTPIEVRLTLAEESPLNFYWGEGTSISERSPTGAMWQNHGMYSESAIAHENALRSGAAKLPHGATFDGLGKPLLEYGKPGRAAIYEDGQFTGRYEDTRTPVLNSKGAVIDYASQETVEITAEAHEAGGIEPNITAMFRWSDTDRVLRKMARADYRGTFAFEVLRIVYGPEGARWETLAQSGEKCFRGHNRVAALYASNRYGQSLLKYADELRKAAGQPPDERSLSERLESAVRDVGTGSATEKSRKRALLDKARRVAEQDLWRASAEWRKAWADSQKLKPAPRWTGKREDEQREIARIEREANKQGARGVGGNG